jgi:hypothetical protein
MRLLVPYLFPRAQLWATATPDLRVPTLQKLLHRGRLERVDAAGVEAALCAALGFARQTDWPVASLTLSADGGHEGRDYWLRADPVHLAVMRDNIVVAGTPTLTMDEASALAASIKAHFGDDFAPQPLHPARWYLRLGRAPVLETRPLSLAIGRSADACDFKGHDAGVWRQRINELQMVLHAHPVNAAREARGQPVINSLWLWGGGVRPVMAKSALRCVTQGEDRIALLRAAGAECLAAKETLKADLVVLDALTAVGQAGDVQGWRDALREIDQRWLAPLALRRRAFALEDPIHGWRLIVRKRDYLKFWQRGRTLRHFQFDG